MNPDDIARILDELGQRLGPSGEYVFALAVRQVYIEVAIGTIFLALTLAAVVILLPRIYRWAKDDSFHRDIEAFIGGGLITIPALISVVNFVAYALPKLLNPEYAALTDILSRIVP